MDHNLELFHRRNVLINRELHMAGSSIPKTPIGPKTRVRVFIDYWNFQLTLEEREAAFKKTANARFSIDWLKLGPWLAEKACACIGVARPDMSFDGINVYASYNKATDAGRGFHSWVTNWLDRQPGVDAKCFERKQKAPPKCPTCHKPITHCPHASCGQKIVATVEKGVDTLIATDMIRLAWEEAYDVAVLASLDADLIPAVEFLNLKGRKIIQAGFPPGGGNLATSCWASFDVFKDRYDFHRPKS